MSNEIDKEKLIKWLEDEVDGLFYGKCREEINQIVALIGASKEVTKPCPESSTVDKDKETHVKKGYGAGMQLKSPVLLPKKEKSGKPKEVTEEWIEKWIANLNIDAIYGIEHKTMREMLKEIGVEVRGK